MPKTKVVSIGGGNGAATTIKALKNHVDEIDLKAIISMSDSGGSSGRLREEFNTVPPGDILRGVLAMSKYDSDFLKDTFYRVRFDNCGKLDKHNLGNLFLVLASEYSGSFINGVRAMEQTLGAVGQVCPATLDQTHLNVELSNGEVVKTEAAIDRPDYDRSLRIKKAWLEPDGVADQSAIDAIKQADYLVFGPGSLYTSIIATILPKGIRDAIEKSSAKIIYVTGSIYEKTGETGPTVLSEFVKELQVYLPRKIDHVIYNVHELDDEEKEKYKQKNWITFENDSENLSEYNVTVEEYEKRIGKFDTDRLGDILLKIINT